MIEHLDRLARDARDDRQIELDMVNAYTRLANVQGNPYHQNIGDPKGALQSLDKAMTFATALRAADWRDPDVLQAYALEQQARSKVLYALGGEDYSETALQAGLQAFERRLTLHQTNGGRSGGGSKRLQRAGRPAQSTRYQR